MKPGDRVWKVYGPNERIRQETGTVERVSPAGYVRVRWDDFIIEHFSPGTKDLQVVTGDDALPRHAWAAMCFDDDPPCLRCGAIQNDENEFGPCLPLTSNP